MEVLKEDLKFGKLWARVVESEGRVGCGIRKTDTSDMRVGESLILTGGVPELCLKYSSGRI